MNGREQGPMNSYSSLYHYTRPRANKSILFFFLEHRLMIDGGVVFDKKKKNHEFNILAQTLDDDMSKFTILYSQKMMMYTNSTSWSSQKIHQKKRH